MLTNPTHNFGKKYDVVVFDVTIDHLNHRCGLADYICEKEIGL